MTRRPTRCATFLRGGSRSLWSWTTARSLRRFRRPWPPVRPSRRSTVQAAAAAEPVAEQVSRGPVGPRRGEGVRRGRQVFSGRRQGAGGPRLSGATRGRQCFTRSPQAEGRRRDRITVPVTACQRFLDIAGERITHQEETWSSARRRLHRRIPRQPVHRQENPSDQESGGQRHYSRSRHHLHREGRRRGRHHPGDRRPRRPDRRELHVLSTSLSPQPFAPTTLTTSTRISRSTEQRR